MFATKFGTTRPTFNYFGHFHNYFATIRNFILLVASILHLFSFINRLICPISRNSHQISDILKVFYNDIGVYFNVCIKLYIYIYIICMHMYIVHIMNPKINIWILKFFIQIWNLLFQMFKTLFEFENFDLNMIFSFQFKKTYLIYELILNSKLIFSNPKISISIQKNINWS